ncbi:maltose/maltodextrin ABC transporter substrate-binding protein MalE [Chitinimonas sp. BJB300]|uniref:maltose/maltodextrin ABC transporter substrate-binding protein MalE n=1 Tax=Chitinimonas sp. BJB300 TaxID=1559339 RepID=UPI000C114B3C|nr:maltose/maltodextrin ABC transporter substrate-binding protein MalE [Chitinimonas sp. BJB300]PHV11835.1 maltose/maltodextrin ABC transporter substrate-binding protein MalE [Chitinimonas sp. BJB300]TSJ88627.1 maltose/maltodextrin ABC transporter substrate-binding protein MalE [Chitinimonas sp. BJB300]
MKPSNTCIVLALAAGFASAHAADAKLSLWINGDKGYKGIQKVGEDFAKQSGVAVAVEHPEDAPAKFQQAAAAGKGPDIFCWPHDRAGEWIAAGLISPLKPSKKVIDALDPLAVKSFTIGGKVWGYPLSIEAIALIYNKALVPNPPKTFEEIFALDKPLKAKGKKTILWDYTKTYFSWPLLSANGAYPFKPKSDGGYDITDIGVNNAGAQKGVEMLTKLVKSGVMPQGATYADMENGFAKGELAMMISGPWAWDNVKQAKIDFGVATIPSIGGKQGGPFVGVLGCMVSNSSKNKEIAVDFLENHLMSLDGLKKMNADVPLGVPANKAFFKELQNDANIKATMASAQLGAPMPNVPEMGRFWSSMESALQNITSGRQSVKEGLDAAAKRITGK